MAKKHFLQFFQDYNGKLVDLDGYPKGNKFQCMDLMHLYHMECLDLTDRTILAAPTAKEVYVNFPRIQGSQFFQRIPNLPWTVPKQGDIVFWREPFGPYMENGVRKFAGHVAIVNEANVRRFTSFDQNFAPDFKCRLVEHNYRGVMGFLRFKGK